MVLRYFFITCGLFLSQTILWRVYSPTTVEYLVTSEKLRMVLTFTRNAKIRPTIRIHIWIGLNYVPIFTLKCVIEWIFFFLLIYVANYLLTLSETQYKDLQSESAVVPPMLMRHHRWRIRWILLEYNLLSMIVVVVVLWMKVVVSSSSSIVSSHEFIHTNLITTTNKCRYAEFGLSHRVTGLKWFTVFTV